MQRACSFFFEFEGIREECRRSEKNYFKNLLYGKEKDVKAWNRSKGIIEINWQPTGFSYIYC
jgi:hypothetical protein